MFFVYILQSIRSKQFYKGLTNDLDRRIKQHELGLVNFTRNKLPLRLVHVELCTERVEARKIEKFFKSGYGREIIGELAENN